MKHLVLLVIAAGLSFQATTTSHREATLRNVIDSILSQGFTTQEPIEDSQILNHPFMSGSFTYIDGETVVQQSCSGALPDNYLEVLKEVKPGEKVYLEAIKVKAPEGKVLKHRSFRFIKQ